MILVKYCEEGFNITKRCNTLQLGTFQYYREKDPSFSIADPEEGYVQISADHKSLIEVPYAQWNRLFGQIMSIDENSNVKMGGGTGQQLPGNIKFNASDGQFVFDGDRKVLKFNADLDFKFFYPNSYIFCLSQEPNKESIDPKRIDNSYDSYYLLSEQKVPLLVQYISSVLTNTVRLEDIDSAGPGDRAYQTG